MIVWIVKIRRKRDVRARERKAVPRTKECADEGLGCGFSFSTGGADVVVGAVVAPDIEVEVVATSA